METSDELCLLGVYTWTKYRLGPVLLNIFTSDTNNETELTLR